MAKTFDLKLLAADPYAETLELGYIGARHVALDELMRESDFVVVACLLNDETRGLIGARELALMKPTAYFVNVARGPIVDEKALYEVLAARRIAGAGLDVFEQEPTPAEKPDPEARQCDRGAARARLDRRALRQHRPHRDRRGAGGA